MDKFKVTTALNQLEEEIKNLSNQQSTLNFYEYESRFLDIMRSAECTLLEASLGKVPNDRRKKKAPDSCRQD